MALSLRERQIAAIKRLLQLNAPTTDPAARDDSNSPTNTADDTLVWKVLIVDNDSRDVISSVLRVHDLRAAGVTVHFNINSKRHPITDSPAIYLLSPTAENLHRIVQDLSNDPPLYSPVYLNFLTTIPRAQLEDFGAEVAASGTAEHIAALHDQTLDYVVSDNDLFHLNINDGFHTINSPSTSDEKLDELINRIVSGLFSVIVTMGVVPIIRCQKGGAGEDISAKLDRKLRDHVLNSKDNLFDKTLSRPVLIIVDRTLDLCPMLSHSWIYQSLVYDVLGMHLGKVELTIPNDKDHPERGTKKQTYDITASDKFWAANATEPFPNVAENVTQEWSRYQADADAVTKKTGSNSIEDMSQESNQFAAHLKGALAMLPELRERKTTIESHMSILEAVMDDIQSRKLDAFFTMEGELSKFNKSQILTYINDTELGSDPMDKMRFWLQWYLTTEEEVSRGDLDSFVNALQAAGADTTAVSYVKTVRQLTRMTMISAPTQQATSNTSSQLFGGFSSLGSRLKDAGLSANIGAIEGVLSNIKGYLPKNSDLTLTKLVESLVDPQNASASAISKTESYLYFDPRSANARGIPVSQSRNQQNSTSRGIEATFGQKRQGFAEAIVFPVGGGSMDEYGNLQEWAKRTSAAGTGQKRRIVYGSTALYSPKDFINNELVPLGKEST